MSHVIPVTDATYRARVADNPEPVLLVFLPGTGDIRRVFAPVLAETAQRLGDRVTVATVDPATSPETTHRWGVTQTPTAVLLRHGIVERVLLGVRPADRLVDEIGEVLDPG